MVTYYELKDLICRAFGNRQDEINDNDVELTVRRMHYSESKPSFILKNNELKEIFEKVCLAQTDGLELIFDNRYEVAVELDYLLIRRMEFPQISLDEENNIEYQIGLCSVEYCIFLLVQLIEKCNQQNKRVIVPDKLRRGLSYRIEDENDDSKTDWKSILIQIMREFSIKIKNQNNTNIEEYRKKKEAYVFEFIYKTEQVISEYIDIEDIFPASRFERKIIDNKPDNIEAIPRREYIADVVDYYRLAFASADPYIKYISFYHIMEYFYDEIYKRKMVEDLTNKITHPDFSYKNEEKVYEIATFVKNRMHMNDESGQGDELESLKYVLKEYVEIEQLKSKLNSINEDLVMFYQNNKVAFCKAPAISWNDSEGLFTQIAKRIYYTRNSLIHSKSGKNRERYKPYKDEKALQMEIPLVRVIAEMIIINSSKVV